MNNINIRPYNSKDRDALRMLCCDVADMGGPIENIFSDRDLAADLLTKYYTDYEPQSTFVAECDGRLVGYVNGCMDNRRYGLVMFWILLPCLLAKGLKRGIFFRRETSQMVAGMLKNWRRIFVLRKKSFSSHQGHLHIGITQDARRQHTGQELVLTLVDYARRLGVFQLEASVHGANKAAGVFFEAQGFVVGQINPMIMMREGKEEHYNSLSYVKTIKAH